MTRVMKARKSSRVTCGCYVLVGELIANHGDGWRCLDCHLAGMKTTAAPAAAEPTEETPP